MSKKQSRQNRGARSGGHGHDHSSTAEKRATPEPTTKATDPSEEPARRISEHHSHKQPRKFGHN
ncbi:MULTISPECIES: hypothetical protein [Streptomyces]|jgi:hypothetical protein|uniref:Uncharacterized protein n=2 Tax=Streptomyces TaxID=1883 RepID=A0AAU1U2G7_9ACTN|nr:MULTISPECIES: hypothetical protein [unclassified Streptomyces]MCX4648960.1 hypothetical protein [Streptomyces sp. NBC_01446]MCX5322921.1 hypothetical protein [Streptomyces sp. NBC_00120]WSD93622.1 hypothetical protein OG758_05135 [Streptomyces sp. NBC_01474]